MAPHPPRAIIALPPTPASEIPALEAPWMRVFIVDKKAVREQELQTALSLSLEASKCTWADLAGANHMPSLVAPPTGAPAFACEGKRYWVAIERESATSVTVYIGLTSRGLPTPPDIADLARSGPRELLAALRRYGGSSHSVTVEMHDGGRPTSMVLKLPEGKLAHLAEPNVLQVPVGALVPTGAAAIAYYVKEAKLAGSLLVVAFGLVLALLVWLLAAVVAARRAVPAWERKGWEVSHHGT